MLDHQEVEGGALPSGPCFEPHYSCKQLSKMWGLSVDTIRHLFEDEAGVIKLGHPESLHKRKYVSLRNLGR